MIKFLDLQKINAQYAYLKQAASEVIDPHEQNKRVVMLNRLDYGLLVVPGIWRDLMDFSSGAICMVLASEVYDENDYIRNKNDFLPW